MITINLLISNNIKTIQEVKEIEPCDVALSIESALIRSKYKRYSLVIVDGIDVSKYFNETISSKNYLKKTVTTKGIKIIKQKIIAVWSVKGGTGKTTAVKKIAESFDQNINVLIIDLNFQDGGSDLSYMLELPVIPHMGMWFKDKTKENFLKSLIQYKQNVFVLQAPPKRNMVQHVDKQDIDELVRYARQDFDVIVFDLPNDYNETVEAVLENATKKIIISSGLVSEAKRIKEINQDFVVIINSANKSWKPFFTEFEHYEIKNIERVLKGE